MKKIIIFLTLLSNILASQVYNKTVGLYSTRYNKKEIKGKSYQSKVTLNSNSGLLVVEDNLIAIHLEDLKTDTLFKNNSVIFFKFQTTIQKNLSVILKENKNANLMQVEGTLTINNIIKDCVAYWMPVQLNSSSSDILIDFEIKFNPEDFNLSALNFPFTNTIEFEIEDGLILKIE